jgi:hypothetical protein
MIDRHQDVLQLNHDAPCIVVLSMAYATANLLILHRKLAISDERVPGNRESAGKRRDDGAESAETQKRRNAGVPIVGGAELYACGAGFPSGGADASGGYRPVIWSK